MIGPRYLIWDNWIEKMFYTDPKSKKSKLEPALHGLLCCLVVFVSHSKTFFHMRLVNWSSWAGHTRTSPISDQLWKDRSIEDACANTCGWTHVDTPSCLSYLLFIALWPLGSFGKKWIFFDDSAGFLCLGVMAKSLRGGGTWGGEEYFSWSERLGLGLRHLASIRLND